MNAKLRCTVYPGQFSAEYAVVVTSFNGKAFSLFASRRDVDCDRPPTEDQSSEGWLAVRIVKRSAAHYLVQLPQTTLENGRFVSVRPDQLEILPTAQGATAAP